MMITGKLAKSLSFVGVLFLLGQTESLVRAADAADAEPTISQNDGIDVFQAIDEGIIEAKFIARNSERGKLILTNLTNAPVDVIVPDAFAGVPILAQMGGMGGGMGGGMMGGGGMGGGMQGMGGGAGGGGGRGGGGRAGGRGGGGRGAQFNVAPEQVTRIDVPLVCLDHGLREPTTSKPYEIRPIEDVVADPATIEIIKAYTLGELPFEATQAAVWHTNSQVGWDVLATKLTGTERNIHRAPYFSSDQLQDAVAIVNRAQAITSGQVIEPRNWTPVSQRTGESSQTLEVESPEGELHESYDPEIDGGL